MTYGYLKGQMESQRHLAMILTKSLREVKNDYLEVIDDAKLGADHIINYGSCFVPDDYYRKACSDMFRNDVRLIKSLYEIYERGDVILDMVEIYFNKTLKRMNEESLNEKLKKLFGIASKYYSTKSSKGSLSLTLTYLLINRNDFKDQYFKFVHSFVAAFVTASVFAAKLEIASLAVHKLKIQDDEYYQLLYNERIEMLYFLIEPSMSKIIYQIQSSDNNEDVIANALYKILEG
ncbi:hypothetical protein ACN0IV_05990 [Trabulsiella odontotermitis]|uniref:hypothetical protein n=1 Tax=Trabulsiella odontotermitis TaxID=379893 RepID=UPI003AC9D489